MIKYSSKKTFGKNWVYRPGKAGHYQFSRDSFWEKQAKDRGLSIDDAYDVERDFGGNIREAKRDLQRN